MSDDAEPFFVDTNILLYMFDSRDPVKQDAARLWVFTAWEQGRVRLSWQVLHEFYTNVVRKLGAATVTARSLVKEFATWQPDDVSLGLTQRAWHWMDTAQLSYWDGLIVAAAERAGCRWLLSEDFQAGRQLGDLTVVDPFRAQPAEYGIIRAE